MPVETAEDLDAFFDSDEFAASATLHSPVGTETSVTGILDGPPGEVSGEHGDVHARDWSFTGRVSELADAREGWELVVGDRTYTVRQTPHEDPSKPGVAILALALETL